MSQPLLLGIDLGTSYFKVGLFDVAGALKGLGRVAVATQSPAPGFRELPVADFWKLLRGALADALARAGADAKDIAGLSYSSQANTFVLLDEHDNPLTPLILWTDQRAGVLEPRLRDFSQSTAFAPTTGLFNLSGQHAAAKLLWFQKHRPDLWARVRRVMTLSDYFTFALTGKRAGDASTAALLGLYDLGAKTWWRAALDACGLDASMLSTPLPPATACAETAGQATSLLGVPPGAKFAVGGLDHHLAAIGSGLGRLADISISTGTVLAAITLAPAVRPAPGCIHGPHTGGRGYYRLAFDPNGAGQLEDYQRNHAPALTIDQLLALAENPAGANGENTRHGTAVRAILERTAAVHRRLVSMVADGRMPARVVATGGGSRSPLWLQINADALGIPVVAPASPERACLGAAMFAGIATGLYSSLDACAGAMVREDRVYVPAFSNR